MHQKSTRISIIVPVFNEEHAINHASDYFLKLKNSCELIFIDGNSSDDTVALLTRNGFQVINAGRASRGAQLYQGATLATHNLLLFHHLDSRLPDNFDDSVQYALRSHQWGRFDVHLDSSDWRIKLVEKAMNLRSRITGIATGDQAMFVRKDALLAYASELKDYPVMEDIYLSKQLKKSSGPACLRARVLSSARYWQKNGVIVSVVKMWVFRLLYFFGISPQKLYCLYYGKQ